MNDLLYCQSSNTPFNGYLGGIYLHYAYISDIEYEAWYSEPSASAHVTVGIYSAPIHNGTTLAPFKETKLEPKDLIDLIGE